MKIHDVTVGGVDVDSQTRCVHYHSDRDIVAIKFKCCGEWYSCHQCHAELAGHEAELWPGKEFDTNAVLCGACGHELSINEYLACDSVCPSCGRRFNSGCTKHLHYYFSLI